jgi:hypothetical protein
MRSMTRAASSGVAAVIWLAAAGASGAATRGEQLAKGAGRPLIGNPAPRILRKFDAADIETPLALRTAINAP